MHQSLPKLVPHVFGSGDESAYASALVNYFSFLFKRPLDEIAAWYSKLDCEQRAEIHETLKHTVGRCALCHSADGGKHLRLRCLAIIAAAVCPAPLTWVKEIDWRQGQKDMLSVLSDHSQEAELVSLLIGDDALFTQLCVHKTLGAATISKVELGRDSITFTLNIDLSSFISIPEDALLGEATARRAFMRVRDFLKSVNSPVTLDVRANPNQLVFKHGK